MAFTDTSTQLAKGHIFALGGAGLTGSGDYAGIATVNLQSIEAKHEEAGIFITGQTGARTGIVYPPDDSITVDFTIIPEGTSKGTSANGATASAYLPPRGTSFGTSGFPVIKIGAFTSDALNVAAGASQGWVYNGGGSLTGPVDGVWGMKLSLTRYAAITPTVMS